LTSEAAVAREVHLTHASSAQFSLQLVRAYPLAADDSRCV
jgi:hypothetical protein